ncbi:transposase [Microbulbifer rhizosphaerae]|uniref:REP element-mobilizing transposase RayT n=1 Tax=Microbulbifer rhizosphaerae TaxID=1562603 RepID=A0A7W4ZBR6_9GAMM|nr:REP element-mobilizing transposase RayT [Microbulbifer rhizosphaerae]
MFWIPAFAGMTIFRDSLSAPFGRLSFQRIKATAHDGFLELVGKACERYGWLCHAYCLMSNHYHLLLETGTPSLSKGMKYINGTHTQQFNRRHKRVGHVFQRRFKAILVEAESYLLELARYIVLNPVRARMVRAAKDWPWSSYRATAGLAEPHPVLTADWVLGNFGARRGRVQAGYWQFVQEGRGQPSPWESLKNQIYLGSDEFVEDMQCRMNPEQSLQDIPKPQRQSPPRPLEHYRKRYSERNEAMYTLAQVGAEFGVSYATVSRAVKSFEGGPVEGDAKCKA